ncbi:MAG: T9SS type A sorting domain-containing protein [Crocinitomix sp.]|nr:T9SS type A sorting domain-containing protein [Crocinitomix sp.]
MKKGILTLATLIIVNTVNAQCVDEANVFEFTFDGKTYELIKENKNWPDAAECALERGGALVRIDSEEENTALFDAISTFDVIPSETIAPDGGGGAYLWLGGTDRAEEGVWIWDINDDDTGDQFWEGAVDGTPVGGLYNNWGDEPDDFGDLQDRAAMSVNGWPLGVAGEWNDVNDDDNELFFFVEYEPVDGIEEEDASMISIYPNPVSDLLFITTAIDVQIEGINFYAISGQLVQLASENWTEGIDVSNLEAGTYFIEIRLDNGVLFTEKFIK